MAKEIISRYFDNLDSKDKLNKPLDAISKKALLRGLEPYTLNREIAEIYNMCDGDESYGDLLHLSNLSSLRQVIEDYNLLITTSEDIGLKWPRALLPIGSRDGLFLLAVMNKNACEDLNLFYFDVGSGDLSMTLEAPSLSSLLEWILESKAQVEMGIRFSDAFEKLRKDSSLKKLEYDLRELDDMPDSWH